MAHAARSRSDMGVSLDTFKPHPRGELRGGGGARRGSRGVDLSLYVRQRLPRRGAALLPDAEERAWGARGTAGAAGRAVRRPPSAARAPRAEARISSIRAARSTPHRAYTCAAAHHDRRGGARFGDDASQRSGAAAAFASRRDTGTECPTDRSERLQFSQAETHRLAKRRVLHAPVSRLCVYEMSTKCPTSYHRLRHHATEEYPDESRDGGHLRVEEFGDAVVGENSARASLFSPFSSPSPSRASRAVGSSSRDSNSRRMSAMTRPLLTPFPTWCTLGSRTPLARIHAATSSTCEFLVTTCVSRRGAAAANKSGSAAWRPRVGFAPDLVVHSVLSKSRNTARGCSDSTSAATSSPSPQRTPHASQLHRSPRHAPSMVRTKRPGGHRPPFSAPGSSPPPRNGQIPAARSSSSHRKHAPLDTHRLLNDPPHRRHGWRPVTYSSASPTGGHRPSPRRVRASRASPTANARRRARAAR